MRSIQSIFDVDLNRHISAVDFFRSGSWKVSAFRRKETSRYQTGKSAYRCSWCDTPVVARRGGCHGSDHFAHRAGSLRPCAWHTEKGRKPDIVNAGKFSGNQESELHNNLKWFIANTLENDPEFHNVRVEKSSVRGDRNATRPDVFAMYGNRKIAFELQLSTTQVPYIEKRESYNTKHDIFTIWIFHDFVKFRELATSEDIYVTNFFNAFELDGDAIAATKNSGAFHLKAWWRIPESDVPRDQQKWHAELINVHDLKWHDRSKKAYVFDYLLVEAHTLRMRHSQFVKKFETYWLHRKKQKTTAEYKVKQKAVTRFAEILGELWDFSLEQAEDWRFFDLLDRLYEIREGRVLFGDQDLKGRVDTILHSWPWFTDALTAIVKGYNCSEISDWATYQRKVSENLAQGCDGSYKHQQIHAFNPALRFLFPEARMDLYNDI